jgi:hypothetical protein
MDILYIPLIEKEIKMSVGIAVTKTDINWQAGRITSLMNQMLIQAESMKVYFDGTGTPGLVALGFTDSEAAILISAFNDLQAVKELFDQSAFIKQLYGIGTLSSAGGGPIPGMPI